MSSNRHNKICTRCGEGFTDYFRAKLCNHCKLTPKPATKERLFESFYMENAFKEFMEAHEMLVWFPRPGAVMAGGGAFGWITGMDDYDGPGDPIGIGFFRPKAGAHVTVKFVEGTRNLRFETRCWAKTHNRKIALKKWTSWLADKEACPCTGCLASRTLTELAHSYYGDHIKDEGIVIKGEADK